MPMKTKEEFAMSNEEKDYCVHCSRPDGTMQSYDEKLVSMSSFIVRTQGLDNSAAKKVAESMMSKLPAWKKS
jgi:hypothetical protein